MPSIMFLLSTHAGWGSVNSPTVLNEVRPSTPALSNATREFVLDTRSYVLVLQKRISTSAVSISFRPSYGLWSALIISIAKSIICISGSVNNCSTVFAEISKHCHPLDNCIAPVVDPPLASCHDGVDVICSNWELRWSTSFCTSLSFNVWLR